MFQVRIWMTIKHGNFPKDNISGDFIDVIRLRPKISDTIPGEHIKMSMKFDIGTAKEDGAFNVISHYLCFYTKQKEIERVGLSLKKK